MRRQSSVCWAARSLSLFALAGLFMGECNAGDMSRAIDRELARTHGLAADLAAIPGEWDRVCILGPYSNNQAAKNTLGFDWDVELRTSIQRNEGISLLLFVREHEVVEYIEYPRRSGDFSNLTKRCFTRDRAQFAYDPKPSKGRPGLFPVVPVPAR